MYCDTPTVAYRRKGIDPATGKHFAPYAFFRYRSDDDFLERYNHHPSLAEALILPCGKCLLCTKRHRYHWVLRCMHELHYYEDASYITLTVDEPNLLKVFPHREIDSHEWADFDCPSALGLARPADVYQWPSLCHRPWQLFFKRLRISLVRGWPCINPASRLPDFYHGCEGGLRFYMCGEYGDLRHRPHYHAIIYGFWPPDVLPHPSGRKGLFYSPQLMKIWPHGFNTVARVVPDCISYVAGYVDKKLDNSRLAWAVNNVAPEYTCMSRNPGIGREFCEEFLHTDIYPENADGSFARDYCLVGDRIRVRTPRYYDDVLALRDSEKFGRLFAHREKVGASRRVDIDLSEWLNESHRKHAVAAARRRQREPGVYC